MTVPLSQIHQGLRLRVINQTIGGGVLVRRLQLALSYGGRLRGLLGRPPLRIGEGMLISPCNGVHTFFMRYPIDVLFLDERGRILELISDLAPWRMTSMYGAAVAPLVLAGGAASTRETSPGDQLVFEEY